jgi:cellobiose transport system permease protein
MGLDVDTERPEPPAAAAAAAATAPPVQAGRPRGLLARLDRRTTPYLLVSPYFLLFAVFGFFPLAYTLWVSLHDWELAGDKEFLGLQNYTRLLADEAFWNAVVNTVGMFVLATVPQLVIALALANALNRRIRFRLLFRMGVLLPLVTSVVAVAVVFSQLYGRDFGMVNWLLGLVGVGPVFWQGEKWSSWIAISSMVDWRWTGYNAIIYLAAMQAIPRDLYEAAAIDGASAWRQFWKITVPLLRPTIIFTAFISTIGGLTLFAEPVMFGGGRVAGGTLGQFQTVTMFIVDKAFRDFEYGFAAAAAWLLFLLILLGSMINFFFVSRIRGGTR